MPLQLIRQDITRMNADAIVNAANHSLCGGGGVDGAIHRAAGPELLRECLTLGGCRTGEAKATRGYRLPARYVIHTVGPVWRGGAFGEREKLISCYHNCLQLAHKSGCETIAFPLISAGAFGYPMDQAIRTAVNAISSYLMENDTDMMVYLVIFSQEAMQTGSRMFAGIQQYIDDSYAHAHTDSDFESLRARNIMEAWEEDPPCMSDMDSFMCPSMGDACAQAQSGGPMYFPSPSLEEALGMIDESFSEMVLRRIREKGMKNVDCYKKANLDKKHFSKISSDVHYKPKKTTALALAVALEMDLQETRELLMKAGLAFNHSEKFDIIVEFFIREGRYDIFEINEALFFYDQPLLGCAVL